jgi:hypothetical protein
MFVDRSGGGFLAPMLDAFGREPVRSGNEPTAPVAGQHEWMPLVRTASDPSRKCKHLSLLDTFGIWVPRPTTVSAMGAAEEGLR